MLELKHNKILYQIKVDISCKVLHNFSVQDCLLVIFSFVQRTLSRDIIFKKLAGICVCNSNFCIEKIKINK